MSDVVMARGLSLVMATRNESECIGETVRKLASVLSNMSLDTELIIADYSEDDTLGLAVATGESCSLRIVPLEVGRPGRGYALRMGIEAACYDLICLIDGDGNHDPKYIPRLLEAYKPGCIVAATRFPPLGWSEEHTFFHYYGNRLAVAAFNLLFGAKISDITNGFYIMSRKVWNCLSPDSDNWSFDAQIVCRALKRGVDIIEIPYSEPKRKGGRASLNLVTAFWRIGGRVLLESMTS
jgi:glycosyltransferase involved in cell wall biosynthesis